MGDHQHVLLLKVVEFEEEAHQFLKTSEKNDLSDLFQMMQQILNIVLKFEEILEELVKKNETTEIF